eukprot:1555901-Rhodomonas_salina.4
MSSSAQGKVVRSFYRMVIRAAKQHDSFPALKGILASQVLRPLVSPTCLCVCARPDSANTATVHLAFPPKLTYSSATAHARVRPREPGLGELGGLRRVEGGGHRCVLLLRLAIHVPQRHFTAAQGLTLGYDGFRAQRGRGLLSARG